MKESPKPPHNPHDRFFRNAMENNAVAQGFMQYYLPSHIHDALDLDSLSLEHDSYLDAALRETVSDLVYRCKLAGKPAFLALLVEHQSTPDPHMPVRIGHYLFSLLTKQLKQAPSEPLAPVHALVFYHGSQTPYPYSMSLADCFKDPLGLMKTLFQEPIPLVDINQLSDDELKQQRWIGIVARVLKHIREPHIDPYLLEWLLDCATLGNQNHQQLDFIKTLLNYVMREALNNSRAALREPKRSATRRTSQRNGRSPCQEVQRRGRTFWPRPSGLSEEPCHFVGPI